MSAGTVEGVSRLGLGARYRLRRPGPATSLGTEFDLGPALFPFTPPAEGQAAAGAMLGRKVGLLDMFWHDGSLGLYNAKEGLKSAQFKTARNPWPPDATQWLVKADAIVGPERSNFRFLTALPSSGQSAIGPISDIGVRQRFLRNLGIKGWT
jgi:hypothetical protein